MPRTFRRADDLYAVNEHRLLEMACAGCSTTVSWKFTSQPIFNCESLEITGFRGIGAGGGIRPAATFRPMSSSASLEECGLINRLGARVLEQACMTAASWQPPCRIAVNVSTLQLRDGGLQDEVAAILMRTGLPAALLDIEVTESVMADDNKQVMDTLLALKAMGARIVLDDFGTGYLRSSGAVCGASRSTRSRSTRRSSRARQRSDRPGHS